MPAGVTAQTMVTVPAHAAFITYAILALVVIIILIWFVSPAQGTTNIFVYIGICSLAGSLSVMSCKV